MTDTQLLDFHRWLYSALPADAKVLTHELELSHRAKLPILKGMELNAVTLADAMKRLEVRGLVERRGSEWFWVAERQPMDAQKELFA